MTYQGVSASTASNYYYEKDPIFNADGIDQKNIEWHGKLADQLGIIDSNVTAEQAYGLFNGKSLDGETQLLDRSKTITSGKENAVFDIPLTAPKPISALALMKDGDPRVLEAFNEAVKTTVGYVEDNIIQTRGQVKQDDGTSKRETYKTGNALIATAQHSTNRNNDLHLHSHMLLVNQTYDKHTDSYKALNLDFKSVTEIQAVLSTELLKNVRELEYAIEVRDNGQWNIKGFDENIISAMSTRTEEIRAVIDKLPEDQINKDTGRRVGFLTKNEKDDSITSKDIQDRAKEQLASVGTTIKELKDNALSQEPYQNNFENAKEVLEKAGNHLSQSNARFTERELLKASSTIAFGEYSYKDLKEELSSVKKIGQTNSEEIKRLGKDEKTGNEVFTTKEMHTIEKENLAYVNKNIQLEPIMSKEQATRGISDFEKEYFTLSDGQRDAAMHILTSTDQVGATQGLAGSGKSVMFKSIAHSMKYNDNNTEVLVSAVANKAVTGAVEASTMNSGESFTGQTLHKATRGGLKEVMGANDSEHKTEVKPQTKLLIIEEASMASASDVHKILKDVEELRKEGTNVKVQLVGDTNQLLPIGAGSPFEQIQKALGDSVVQMPESQRQRNQQQQDVTEPIAKKDIRKSLENLEKAGALKEVKDPEERIKAVVNAITKKESVDIQNFKGETETKNIDYKNTIGLAATNKENKAINLGVRAKLKEEGLIKNEVKTTINVGVLKDNIKQSSASNYEKGMKLTTFEHVKSMAKNTEYKVVGIDEVKNTLKLKTIEPDKDGKHHFSVVKTSNIAGRVSINKEEEISLGEGDKIRVTETSKEAGLTNSDQGIVTSMDKGNKIATVDFGEQGVKKVDLNEHKGISYSYSITNHSGQGLSIEKVVANFSTEDNKQLNSMNSFYVAMSRQTAQSELIVDDKEKLMNQVSKEASSVSSLDNLKKPEEVKMENKVSDKVADEIKYFKQNNDFDKREGKFVSPKEDFSKSQVVASERDYAKINNNEEFYKEKSSEFMNQQIVARNGYSQSRVEDYTQSQVDTGKMTEKAAENFVENSHSNAKELEKAGILELKGNDTGAYKFTDAKSKEILHDYADKKVDDIAQKNLDAYSQLNTKTEVEDTSNTESKVDIKGNVKLNNQDIQYANISSKFAGLSDVDDINKETEKFKNTKEESIKHGEINGNFSLEKQEVHAEQAQVISR